MHHEIVFLKKRSSEGEIAVFSIKVELDGECNAKALKKIIRTLGALPEVLAKFSNSTLGGYFSFFSIKVELDGECNTKAL